MIRFGNFGQNAFNVDLIQYHIISISYFGHNLGKERYEEPGRQNFNPVSFIPNTRQAQQN